MDSFANDSLHTTASSVDLGTTFEEPECFTSTPVRNAVQFSPEVVNPLGPPPPKPTAPKPRTVVRRLTMNDVATSLSVNRNTTEQRLRTLSFKRQKLELKLDHLQRKTVTLRARDERIKRRHAQLRRQRSKIDANSSGNSSQDSDSDEPTTSDTRRLSLPTRPTLSTYRSQGKFRRNSVVRRASHKRPRHSSPTVTLIPSVRQTATASPEPVEDSVTQTDRTNLIKKPVQKVKRTPSLRLKRFVQKKLKFFA